MASIELLFKKQTIFKIIDNFIFLTASVEENERKESESNKKSAKKNTRSSKKKKRRKRCRKLMVFITLSHILKIIFQLCY